MSDLVKRLRDNSTSFATTLYQDDILAAADRIEELKNLLERWCEYYVDGMSGDDVQELYVDTLYTQEEDDV